MTGKPMTLAEYNARPATEPKPGPSCPTCGRFWAKGQGTFDKKAYMRDYMKGWRKKAKPGSTT